MSKIKKELTGEKPKIRHQLTAKYDKKDYEQNNHPSMTVPGQTMSVLEMVKRHRQGLPIDQAKGALYTGGDQPLQDLDKMDLIDRQAYVDSVADALVEIRAKIAGEARTIKERETMERVDKIVRDKMEELRKTFNKGVTDLKEIE